MSSFSLRSVELFSGLDDTAIERLADGHTTCSLAEGDTLFREGEPGEVAYIVTKGELEIFKLSRDSAVRIAVSGPGVIVGEMSLLTGEPRNASARALVDTELIALPKASLDALLASNAHAVRALFDVFIARWREQQSRLRQAEHMAQIGVLTAGLAHEMNNPAAAVTRGSDLLPSAIERRAAADAALPPSVSVPIPAAGPVVLSPVDRAAVETDLELTLDALGVEQAWSVATALVDAGYRSFDFTGIDETVAEVVVEAIAARSEVAALVSEVAEGSKRLSELVGALKSYAYLDQAPVQNVDVTKGIDDTLLILKSKTADTAIVRDYAPDLPHITAHGSRLNQVWTNLIDNAADAIRDGGVDGGRIMVTTSYDTAHVIVTIENNGPEIPESVQDRIFEAFFTTKEPGSGTGLGLDTVRDIVINQHHGMIDVVSTPDRTAFTVTLPIDPPPSRSG